MISKIDSMKLKIQVMCKKWKEKCLEYRHPGIDGILVTVGLCVIALVLCVIMQTELKSFIESIVEQMTTKAENMLKYNS